MLVHLRRMVSTPRAQSSALRVWLRDPVRLALLHLLAPAAVHLSRDRALGLARLAGKVDASRFLNAGMWRDMQVAFRLDRARGARAARDHVTTRYTDFVINRRILKGREDPGSWRVEERNPEVVDELRRTGASFVIATGHFVRHASYALFTGMTIPQRIAIVTLPSSDVSRPTSFNSRLNALHKDLVMDVWGGSADVEFLTVDNEMSGAIAVRRLREPGNVVIISSDAYAGLDGRVVHQRPFAGWRLRRVALGTAMIARFAQVPVVLCHPYVEPDGTVVLEWDGPIRAKDEGSDGDIELMDAVLDGLERMVGKRPNQYVYPIGGERTWDPDAARWTEPPIDSESQAVAGGPSNGA